ncbi:hypothetical protein GGX14DRAFT_362660 [Mycena pura]|uniref:Uncharacterized protein n=1 Tax=Mycena pura TaxID=153505 RepID=A0AAD6YB24_9AGAR|nr:hypothetical protein GGX14DRAFT_362660 [Mycena pura]
MEAKFAAIAKKDGIPWSRAHSNFANMGGFVIKFGTKSDLTNDPSPTSGTDIELQARRTPTLGPTNERVHKSSTQIGQINWHVDETNVAAATQALATAKASYLQNDWEKRRFLTTYRRWFSNLLYLLGDVWVVDAPQLLLARELGIIDRLPVVLKDDLEDRNKGDMVVKIFAVGQIGWFVIQLCVRFAARLATSQLEILTLAYALCTAITYFLLRDTPKDCQFSLSVPAVRHPSAPELFRVALVGPTPYMLSFRDHFWIPNSYFEGSVKRKLNGWSLARKGNLFSLTVGSIVAVFLLGCVHCIAWDFVFPTDIERTLWQASSIITAAVIPVGFLLALVNSAVRRAIHQQLYRRISSVIFFCSCVLLAVGFFVSRIFIVVEALRSLAFLPPNVYATTWSANIPHIG